MPPKRKAAVATAAPMARTLRSFANVSKSTSTNTATKKRKLDLGAPKTATIVQDGDEDVLIAPPKRAQPVSPVSAPEKRKRKSSPAPSPKRLRKATSALKESPPALPTPPASQDTTATDSTTPPASQDTITTTDTTPDTTTPPASQDPDPTLSALPALHSALLTTLALHHTHTHTPPTYLTLWPQIERLSGHTLTLPLLRRVITLSTPYLTLQSQLGILRIRRGSPPASTELQKSAFAALLHTYGTLAAIPEAAITALPAPLRAARRPAVQALTRPPRPPPPPAAAQKGTPKQRTESLLSRIAAKGAVVVESGEEKEERAARARTGEVEGVLRGLRGRGSVAMAEVVEIVVGSLRGAMSKSEAERAVGIVLKEGGGVGWGRVVERGGVRAVVFGKSDGGRFI